MGEELLVGVIVLLWRVKEKMKKFVRMPFFKKWFWRSCYESVIGWLEVEKTVEGLSENGL